MKKMQALVLAALLGGTAGAAAQETGWDGPLSEYTQRTDSVTRGAGDAKAHNAAIHAIDPSPAEARNRAIPGNGERLSRAIRRYQDVTKLQEAVRPIGPETAVGSGSGSGSSGSAASGK
jgi:hypothetical protein